MTSTSTFDYGIFYPRNLLEGATLLLAAALWSFFGLFYFASAITLVSYSFWITATRFQRGYWLFKPVARTRSTRATEAGNPVNFDKDLTKLYRDVFDTPKVMVSLDYASQYEIHVIHHDDLPITSKLGTLARRLGIESLPGKKGPEAIPVIFFEVWKAGCSALLIKKQADDWGNAISFKPETLTRGKPRAYIGDAINGNPIIIDHTLEHGAGVFGTSGSGKTEVFVVHHASMLASGLNPEVHILDLKGTPQLKRLSADSYISKTRNDEGEITPDIEGAYELLTVLNNRLSDRMDTYSHHDCDNLWQYRKKIDANERPIILYIDELAVLSRAAKQAGKDDPVANIMMLLASLAQLGRSSGLILLVGMQHPIADDLPTTIRNQIMTRIVLAVADGKAADVAGIPGAQNQPMQGAMMVKHGNRVQIGRGAYIPAQGNKS